MDVQAQKMARGLEFGILKLERLFYLHQKTKEAGPEVIKLFSCSTQLSMKFILLINVKMPTTVGILTFISRIND